MSDDCQVDFYVLAKGGQAARQLACRLALMAWEQGHRVAMRTADSTQARVLDEMMWDYPPGRFLPHAVHGRADNAPVSICVGDDGIGDDRDLVINLVENAVPEPRRFSRLLEIVPAEPGQRSASREKFRIYRDQGLKPSHHTIGKS